MKSMKQVKTGIIAQALEDGLKKAIELFAVGTVLGISMETLLVSSGAVFVGSLIIKSLRAILG